MRAAPRFVLAAAGALAMIPGLIGAIGHMPAFGRHPLPYGDAINRAAPVERHVTNMVTAVNFDYRGIDTIGEEFMLLAAVTGATVLLRGRRGETTTARPAQLEGRPVRPPSDAVTLTCRSFGALLLAFGLYVVLHAQLTPGGGFQGGAILGSSALLIYLGEGYGPWRRLIRSVAFEALEAAGALLFIGAGFGPLIVGAKFLENVLPLGESKQLLSGGLILIENIGVAMAVAGGFTLVLLEFLEETREQKPEDGQ
jgi:multicomponent Na+:H+ antiporter subunit B